jgi:hypothetical protein
MDPGLVITLGAAVVGASALLSRFGKTQKEGFDVVPANNYPEVAERGQQMYNRLTLSSDPRQEAVRINAMSASERAAYEASLNQALTGATATPSGTAQLNIQQAENQNPVFIPDQSDLILRSSYCENKTIDANVFQDTQFQRDCGVCLTGGKTNGGQNFSGPKGLFINQPERERALAEQREQNLAYSKARPSTGYCEGATGGADHNFSFALNKTEYDKLKSRLDCRTNKTLDGDCASCLADGSYTFVGRTDRELEPITFVVAGSGILQATVGSRRIEFGPGRNSLGLSSTPQTFRATADEGAFVNFTVTKTDPDGNAELYGILEAPTDTGGVFQVPLDKILLNDDESGGRPRRARDFPVIQRPRGSVYCARLLSRYGKKSMILTGTLPFLFVGNAPFEGIDCRGSILQTKPQSVELFGGDPCYRPSTQGPGTWTDQCIKDRVQTFGCTQTGQLFQDPSVLRGLSLTDMQKEIQRVASTQFSNNESSMKCTGKNISSPCDPFIPFDVNETPDISPQCIQYLYENKGVQNPNIGPTYTGPVNTYFSMDAQGNKIMCLPGALNDVNRYPDNLKNYQKLFREGYKGQQGIKAIQTLFDESYRRATNTGLNANLPDNRGGRADSIAKCFINLAKIPENVISDLKLPNARFLRVRTAGRSDPIQISQIVALDNRGQNVAFGRPTRSGASWHNQGNNPNTAVDGQTRPRPFPQIYHSRGTPNDFWQVDFTKTYPIREIVYYNRTDCCSQRSNNLVVELLNERGQAVWSANLQSGVPVQRLNTFSQKFNV